MHVMHWGQIWVDVAGVFDRGDLVVGWALGRMGLVDCMVGLVWLVLGKRGSVVSCAVLVVANIAQITFWTCPLELLVQVS